jgi:hypothetical protein
MTCVSLLNSYQLSSLQAFLLAGSLLLASELKMTKVREPKEKCVKTCLSDEKDRDSRIKC